MKKIGTILLIDDDAICTYLNRQILEELQMIDNIVCMNDGQEALDYLEKAYVSAIAEAVLRPDLILMDLNMPGLDGFQLLDQLNQLGGSEVLMVERVVILSTSMHPLDQERASSYNVFDFLVKPLTETKVKKVLERFLHSQSLNSKSQDKKPAPQVLADRSPAGRPAAKGVKMKR